MLHIKKRGTIYHVYWYERKSGDKKARHRSKAISPDYEATKKYAADLARRLYAENNGLPIENYPFDEFCEEYKIEYTAEKHPNTRKKDESFIKAFKRLCPDVIYTDQFNVEALSKYTKCRRKEGAGDTTINRELALFKNMQKVAEEKRYLPKYTAKKTLFIPVDDNTSDYLPTQNEIDLLFSNDGLYGPLRDAAVLTVAHGFRRGEITHLELTDLDFERKTIKIRVKPHLNWKPKNKSSIRDIPMHQGTENFLKYLHDRAKALKCNFLICYDDGSPLNEDVLSSTFRKIRDRLGLSDEFTFHTLRSVFITNSADNNKAVKPVSKLVGHSSIQTTEKIYYKASMDSKREALNNTPLPIKITIPKE